jgi:FKBP-type peptidyl-prolyl cis-trans isomerase SlyD
MQIQPNSIVTFEYELFDDEENLLDRTDEGEPISYIHGIGALLPVLESALEGREAGHSVTVEVPPEEGYGERDGALVQRVAREVFRDVGELEVGMRFNVEKGDESGTITVVDFDETSVMVDGNHPLAGKTLTFNMEVVGVREATPEELQRGPEN